ncbi:unnamed protein product, partial [Choristocarpus tenellus]
IRIGASLALGAVLQLVHERQSTPNFYRKALDEIENG